MLKALGRQCRLSAASLQLVCAWSRRHFESSEHTDAKLDHSSPLQVDAWEPTRGLDSFAGGPERRRGNSIDFESSNSLIACEFFM